MIRRRRPGLVGGMLAALALLAGPALAAPAAPAAPAAAPAFASGWGRSFQLAAPVALDLTPAQAVFSPAGAALIAYGMQDSQQPASLSAWMVQRSSGGGVGRPQQLAGVAQILALGSGPAGLELLGGVADSGGSCCDRVVTAGIGRGGSVGSEHTLFDKLSGAAEGRLVSVGGRLLAVAASDSGVWVAQSSAGGGRFGAGHRVSPAGQLPQSIDAIAPAPGQSLIVWTARSGQPTADGPRQIYLAQGSTAHAPHRGRPVLTVPGGHEVDELALGARGRVPTVAWVESWYDAAGGFRSQVKVADAGSRLRGRTLSAAREVASGLSLAADANGDQVLSWQACTASGDCAVRAVLRRAGGSFGPVQRPGAVDAGEIPAAAVTAGGRAVVAWIDHGHVLAASGPGTGLGHTATVSSTNYAADLTLASGPRGGGLAVWTQGTLNQSLRGAVFHG